jgi:hypothetical protein
MMQHILLWDISIIINETFVKWPLRRGYTAQHFIKSQSVGVRIVSFEGKWKRQSQGLLALP